MNLLNFFFFFHSNTCFISNITWIWFNWHTTIRSWLVNIVWIDCLCSQQLLMFFFFFNISIVYLAWQHNQIPIDHCHRHQATLDCNSPLSFYTYVYGYIKTITFVGVDLTRWLWKKVPKVQIILLIYLIFSRTVFIFIYFSFCFKNKKKYINYFFFLK